VDAAYPVRVRSLRTGPTRRIVVRALAAAGLVLPRRPIRVLAGEERDRAAEEGATILACLGGAMRWIVLADGRLTGGRQKDKGSGWIHPDSQS
jgi:hypothetical protein